MESNDVKAGAYKIDVTPTLGTVINGDFMSHYAYYIHDPLYSKALVLKNKDVEIAIVVVDTCFMPKDFVDETKKLILDLTGILPENILLSSTHTHAGGSVAPILLGAGDVPYREKLKHLIPQSVLKAQEKLRPAKVAFGKVDVPEHVVCRRYYMESGYRAYNPVTNQLDTIKTNPMGDEDKIVKRENKTDTWVGYLGVKGIDDQWISILANYSMHYVGDWENGMITADYFGAFAEALKTGLGAGDDFVGIMSNGTSGDANIMDFMKPDRYPDEPFKKSELIGKDIAQKVISSVETLEWNTSPELAVNHKNLEIAVRKPSAKELEEAVELVSNTRYDRLSMKESSHTGNEDAFRRIFAREQVLLNEYPDKVETPVQAIRIGAGVIGALPAEIFAETGLWLKKSSKIKNYFTICLANDCAGYVPPEREHELGGYETWRCRSSFLEVKAEEILREGLLELINRVK